jgi:hypothetical protein
LSFHDAPHPDLLGIQGTAHLGGRRRNHHPNSHDCEKNKSSRFFQIEPYARVLFSLAVSTCLDLAQCSLITTFFLDARGMSPEFISMTGQETPLWSALCHRFLAI